MVDLSITPYWKTNDHKKPVQVWWIRHQPSRFDALAYVCSLEEDFDGAPRAFGEPNPSPGRFGATVDAASNPHTVLQFNIVARAPHRPPDRANLRTALDFLGNATSHPHNFGVNNEFAWVGLTALAPSEVKKVANSNRTTINVPSLDMRRGLGARFRKNAQGDLVLAPNGEHFFPVIQGPLSPAPGFFVSTTALVRDKDRPETDPLRFFDASAIPYQAFNTWMLSAGPVHVKKGDFGLVIDPLSAVTSGFVLADAGAGNKAGEVSTFLLDLLGGNNERDFIFLLFPNSGGGSILPTANAPAAAAAGALINLPKLNDDSDAASQLVLFLALNCNFTNYSRVKSGSLLRDAMVEAELAYIEMRQLLKLYKLESDATLGVE